MDKIIKKIEALEQKAGSNIPAVFTITNGVITSGGKEYTKEQYNAITAKSNTVINIIDDISGGDERG